MKVKRVEASHERQVLIGMIVNRAVLGAVAARWMEGMFSSRWGNLVAGWCVSYYKKYKKPPGRNVQNLFDAWANQATRDKETIALVEKFLTSLSREYVSLKKAVNPEYVIDRASEYFTKVKQKELMSQVEAALESGDIDEADKLIKGYGRVEVGGDKMIDVLQDREAIKRAFEAKSEPLVTYPHGLGVFFGDALERDGFIAIQGTEKRGKTWMLLDIAWNAMLQGRKVAFFEVGDLSRNQIMRRFMVRASQTPAPSNRPLPRKVMFPTGITIEEGDDLAEVECETRVFKHYLDFAKSEAACDALIKTGKMRKVPRLKLGIYPNRGISIYGIQAALDQLVRQDWMPDVVVIDYADILAPPHGVVDSREQINITWMMMRALSQMFHCLVVTATQAKATAYSVETMGQEHFSEDKRKHAHVTGMVGLNQNNVEKERGVIRLNWIDLREEEFVTSDCCHVAQCLSLGNPAVCSVML